MECQARKKLSVGFYFIARASFILLQRKNPFDIKYQGLPTQSQFANVSTRLSADDGDGDGDHYYDDDICPSYNISAT